jgi:uncharacterized MnhB-related membrane protein
MPVDLIDSLSRLPATAAVTYRGMSAPDVAFPLLDEAELELLK